MSDIIPMFLLFSGLKIHLPEKSGIFAPRAARLAEQSSKAPIFVFIFLSFFFVIHSTRHELRPTRQEGPPSQNAGAERRLAAVLSAVASLSRSLLARPAAETRLSRSRDQTRTFRKCPATSSKTSHAQEPSLGARARSPCDQPITMRAENGLSYQPQAMLGRGEVPAMLARPRVGALSMPCQTRFPRVPCCFAATPGDSKTNGGGCRWV